MDDRDPSRSEASRGHVGNVRSPSDGRDLHRQMLNIGRCGRIVEELHDRGPIEPLSRRDRAAIMELLSRNHSHGIRRQKLFPGQNHFEPKSIQQNH